MKNEADVKKAVKEVLNEISDAHPGLLWYFMPAANGFGRAGIPDFVGTFNGRSFAIETKFGRGLATPHQKREMDAAHRAGVQVYLTNDSTFEADMTHFRAWIKLCL